MRWVRRSLVALLMVGAWILGASIAPVASASSFGVFAWGLNDKGQLGDGTTETSETPTAVAGLEGVASVAGGFGHALALLDDGSVMAWGANADGQLGDGTHEGSHVPVPVPGLEGVAAVATGGYSSYALLSDGTVVAWGENKYGELGDGTTENGDVPVPVPGLTGVIAISAGVGHADALLSDGSVMAWGENRAGQLGDGNTDNSDVPVAVKGLAGVSAIAAGYFHSLALVSGGAVRAWGPNAYGELGDGNTKGSDVPVAVKGLSGVTAIAAGDEYSLAVRGDGTIVGWGSNNYGKLGLQPTERGGEPGISKVPVEPSEWRSLIADEAVSVAAGHETSLVLLRDGNVVSWGQGEYGELGYPYDEGENVVPVEVPGLCDVSGIAAGYDFGLAYGEPGPCPVVSGVSPDAGPPGTSVTIEGSGFDEVTAVDFSGAGASYVVNSPTSITAVVPTGRAGKTWVTVTTARGPSANEAYQCYLHRQGCASYEYPAAPVVKSISPAKGTAAGGTEVTIGGEGFIGASEVAFGGVPASEFEVRSSQEIVAVSPPGTGRVDVVVRTPNGSSAPVKKAVFKYKR